MIIDNPASFFNLFSDVCEYKKQGVGGARIEVKTPTGIKKIYLVGYDNKSRYKGILGQTLGGFLLEEVQIVSDEFIREMFTRLYRDNGFLYCTGNAGLPDQVIYTDYLNKGRPSDEYESEVPRETIKELETVYPDDDFRYWFFRFEDNPTLTKEQISKLYNSHPVGSFEYNSKIVAIRGYVKGLLYARLMNDIYIDKTNDIGSNVRMNDIKTYAIRRLHVGIDIGDNAETVFTLTGSTDRFQRVVVLDSHRVTKEDSKEVDYNEIIRQFNKWFLPYYSIYRDKIKSIRPDAADSLFVKTLRNNITIKTVDVISSSKSTIKNRVTMKEQLLYQNRLLFADTPGAQDVKKNLAKMKTDGKGGHLEEESAWNDYNDSLDYSITPDMHAIMTIKF